MKEIIHESVYDICEKIYDDICYSNNDCHDDDKILKYDLNNFIEDRIAIMSIYDMNTILVSYGIDKAVYDYTINQNIENINFGEFSKKIIQYLIESSFIIKED